jgi:hypothetical protein
METLIDPFYTLTEELFRKKCDLHIAEDFYSSKITIYYRKGSVDMPDFITTLNSNHKMNIIKKNLLNMRPIYLMINTRNIYFHITFLMICLN